MTTVSPLHSLRLTVDTTHLLGKHDGGCTVVARGNDGVRPDLAERDERLGVLAVLHEPSGRFGSEPNSEHEDEGGDEGGSELETPGNVSGVLDDDVGAETKEDA